jgi:putative transposase
MITYSMNFQYKYKHTGALFQGRYKNVVVDSKEQLLHLSKYIHQHQTTYSSLPMYLKKIEPIDWIYPEYILGLTDNYRNFINSTNKSNSKKIKKLTLE